jgi:hypothetical protein
MEHLFASRVVVDYMVMTANNGRPRMEFVRQDGFIDCRLDLTFVRPGKDQPQAVSAGQAPDRMGVMFCSAEPDVPLRAGARITAIENDDGVILQPGTFEIRATPDVAPAYATAHHIEVQIIEVAQEIAHPFGRLPAAVTEPENPEEVDP